MDWQVSQERACSGSRQSSASVEAAGVKLAWRIREAQQHRILAFAIFVVFWNWGAEILETAWMLTKVISLLIVAGVISTYALSYIHDYFEDS